MVRITCIGWLARQLLPHVGSFCTAFGQLGSMKGPLIIV